MRALRGYRDHHRLRPEKLCRTVLFRALETTFYYPRLYLGTLTNEKLPYVFEHDGPNRYDIIYRVLSTMLRIPKNSYEGFPNTLGIPIVFEDDAQQPYVFIWCLKMMLRNHVLHMAFEAKSSNLMLLLSK